MQRNEAVIRASGREGSLVKKPFLRGCKQSREVVLQAGDDRESQIANIAQKGGAGEVPVGDHVAGKTAAPVAHGAAKEPPTGVIIAIPKAVRFNIQG
jgi:hypothetical protein